MEILSTAEQMQGFDRAAIVRYGIPAILLMENAGRACVDALEHQAGPLRGKSVTVLAGKGNNGGDGLVIARHLLNRGCVVSVLLLGRPDEVKGDARVNLDAVRKLRPAGIRFQSVVSGRTLKGQPAPSIVVDAIFGTGFTGTPRGIAASAISWLNAHKAFVMSVDLPSGVDATTGAAEGVAVRADLTVTMGCAKVGHYVGSGKDLCGILVVKDIGIPAAAIRAPRAGTYLMTPGDVRSGLPQRARTVNKYSAGKVFVLAGSRNFTGAAAMCATSALRSGAGAVVLGIPRSIHPMLARKLTEVILLPLPETDAGTIGMEGLEDIRRRASWADCFAIGPGLSRHPQTDNVICEILEAVTTPAVVDADALNALAQVGRRIKRKKGETILTPHTGELSRLLGLTSEDIEQSRVQIARDAARKLGAIVVLKGAPTATADQDGTVVLNPTGNPGMATVGSGDVLTGLIAGLAAQGMNMVDAARAGVFLHGMAGDSAAERFGIRGLLATDIIEALPATLKTFEA